ncbi:CPBP family intramembrane glutamic endopeptidase [Parvularcula marina]|uniref:CPBP family intramembrane glutamic endopeptidase n=1 Tax=Parvularcula marina TaxID=2292771 RepID=UPI00351276AA
MNTHSTRERALAFTEVIAVVAIAFLSKAALDQYFWRFSGPVSLIILLMFLTAYLRLRGINWSDMGMRAVPGAKSKWLMVPQTLLAIVAIIVTGVVIEAGLQAIGIAPLPEGQDAATDRFSGIGGNLSIYLMWLGIGIVSGGLAEEMFFRGYLITRLQTVFNGFFLAPVLVVFIPGLIFGYGHFYYQGLSGWITTGMIGVVIGTLFLLYKRNLWPLIIAHAAVDAIGITAMYLQLDI